MVPWLVAGILMAGGAAACRHPGNEKRYDFKGKVVTVEKDKRLVTVAHEAIKDYMPGMTMPFTLKDDWPLEVLRTGDQITATLVVDGASRL